MRQDAWEVQRALRVHTLGWMSFFFFFFTVRLFWFLFFFGSCMHICIYSHHARCCCTCPCFGLLVSPDIALALVQAVRPASLNKPKRLGLLTLLATLYPFFLEKSFFFHLSRHYYERVSVTSYVLQGKFRGNVFPKNSIASLPI